MRRLYAAMVLTGMLLAAPPAAWAGGNSPGVRIDPNFPPLGGTAPNVGRTAPMQAPVYQQPNPAYRGPTYRGQGSVINCDPYGRCWQQVPGPGSRGARPPGWADDVPTRGRDPYRFDRPQSGVVCDRRTSVCYKNGRLDTSETKDVFGDRAADRARGIRDRRGTGQVFLPDRGVTCNSVRKVCYDNGVPDFSQTRRYFGDRAADALD
jgi:Fels-1 Prophage Protein-like